MTAFAFAALLLVAAALLILLPPLLRRQPDEDGRTTREALNLAVLRDQLRELDADLAAGTIARAAYDNARRELERRVASEVRPQEMQAAGRAASRGTAAAVALGVPLLALALYVAVGNPLALDAIEAQANPHAVEQQEIEAMVAGLARRLESRPDDVEGWSMLARSYDALGDYEQAAKAYAHLLNLNPRDADLLADYADTLGMARGRSLQGEPAKLIARALAINPQHLKALALAGSAAFERRDYAAAKAQWEKIMALAPPDSEIARSTAASIREAQSLLGQAPSSPPVAKAEATAGARLEGTVELDPALRAQAADEDAVFIFARAVEGPRAPLAVLRKQVKDLPLKFALDDAMSMLPNAKLSDFPQVVVGARISKSASPTPAPGDLQGASAVVVPGARDVTVRIDQLVR